MQFELSREAFSSPYIMMQFRFKDSATSWIFEAHFPFGCWKL